MENIQDTKMRCLCLPRSVVGCAKQNRLDRVTIQVPSAEMIKSISGNSSHRKKQEDPHFFARQYGWRSL